MADEIRSLGDFSSEKPADEEFPLAGYWFRLDGEQFFFDGTDANILRIAELAEMAIAGDEGEAGAANTAALGISLKTAMGSACVRAEHPENCPGEFRRLMNHADKNSTPTSVILDIIQMVNEAAQREVEAATSRPTQRRSGSSAGAQGRDAQLSRLMLSGEGDIATDGQPGQVQPPTPVGVPTIGQARVDADVIDERTEQEMARRAAQNAALTVRPRARRQPAKAKGGKGRRTA
jgi:hypothetical protein